MKGSNKKFTTGNKQLEYKGKELSKFSSLKNGCICKSYAVQGFTCNCRCMYRFSSYIHYNYLKQDKKE